MAIGVLVAGVLAGPGALALPGHAWRQACEVARLYEEYQRLSLQNAELERTLQFSRTPEGKELLLRGRYGMVREGEYVVYVEELPPPVGERSRGLRAIIDGLRERADEDLEILRLNHRLLLRPRNWPPGGC